jgi:hypothetical protein
MGRAPENFSGAFRHLWMEHGEAILALLSPGKIA